MGRQLSFGLLRLNSKDISLKNDIAQEEQKENDLRDFLRKFIIIWTLAFYTTVAYKILEIVNAVQPLPYLDEVYHIPQAQEYCLGNFTYWNQKITTLPGLYLLSISVLRPPSLWKETFLCNSFNLRLTNVFSSACNFMLFIWLVDRLHDREDKWKKLLSAINMSIFPPLYFFSFLYYTDVAATCFMLIVFALHLSGRNRLAALMAILSILMRQTNIVWTAFCAARAADLILRKYLIPLALDKPAITRSWQQIPVILKGPQHFHSRSLTKWSTLADDIFKNLMPYLFVAILFTAFVVWNGGLVVGDRLAHTPTVHLPQLLYYFTFALFFAFPHFCKHVIPFLCATFSRWLVLVTLVALVTLVVHYNTMVHPYFLADNRHYIHYVWMTIFQHSTYGRYFLWPLYMFGAFCVYKTVQKTQSFLVTVAFFVCCVLALVPQKLLECRYFVIPFILMRLHVKPESWISLIAESVFYVAINAATICLFIEKPFPWPDTGELQRIMW